MMIRKAFRFRLEPTPEQTHVRARVAGCVRFGWNKGFPVLILATRAA
jgi:putative transposase